MNVHTILVEKYHSTIFQGILGEMAR